MTTRRGLLPARILLAVVGLASFVLLFDAEPTGDEIFYSKSARLLADYLLGQTEGKVTTAPAVFDRIRGNGWHLPGVSIVLLPVELAFGGQAPNWALRLWMLLLNLGLLAVLVETLGKRLGASSAGLFVLFCALSPYYMAHLSSLFGGSLAILSTLLLFSWVDSWRVVDLTPYRAVLTGVLAAMIVYLRAMYLPIVFVLLTAFVLLSAQRAQWRRLPIAALALLLGVGGLLAPWSWWVSKEFGPTLTTTTMPWSQIAAFGERSIRKELREEGEHPNLSFAFHRAILARAKENGITFSEQERMERSRALAAATLPELIRDAGLNIRRYVGTPDGFLKRFEEVRCRGRAGCLPAMVVRVLHVQAKWGWYLCAAVLAGYMLLPFRFDRGSRWLPFFGKSLVFIILLHCFVAFAHDRYYFQLFPVAGVVASWLASHRLPRGSQEEGATRLHETLIALGQVVSAAFAILFVTLCWLA